MTRNLPYLLLAVLLGMVRALPGHAQINAGNTMEYNMANRYWPVGGGKALNFNLPGLMDTGYQRGPAASSFLQSTCLFARNGDRVKADIGVTDRYTGQLLFYYDGEKVYNRNHHQMPHGDSILACASSIADYNAFVVPFPNDENRYYLFTSDYHGPFDAQTGLTESMFYYTVIDMRLNGGLGDVVDTQRNIKYILPQARYVGHVNGPQYIAGNKSDYWLLFNESAGSVFRSYGADSLRVFAYHIDENGIAKEPVVSYIRSFHYYGMKIRQSPDMRYLIILGRFYSTEAEVVTFDYSTGKLKALFSLPYGYLGRFLSYYNGVRVPFPFSDVIFDLEFSSNSKYVYMIENEQSNVPGFPKLTRFDFSELDSASVMASKEILDTLELVVNLRNIRRVDDTMFIYGALRNDLDCIANGGNKDSARYTRRYRAFNDTLAEDYKYVGWTGIRFPIAKVEHLTALTICKAGEIEFSPGTPLDELESSRSGTQFEWADGYKKLRRPIDTGTYVLQYSYFTGTTRQVVTDTFRVTRGKLDEPVIQVDGMILACMQEYDTYQWYLNDEPLPGATQSKLKVTQNGEYKIAVSKGAYCSDTSDVYKVDNVSVDAQKGIEKVQIYPNPVHDFLYIKSPQPVTAVIRTVDGRELLRVEQAARINLSGWAQGLYILQLLHGDGYLYKEEKLLKY